MNGSDVVDPQLPQPWPDPSAGPEPDDVAQLVPDRRQGGGLADLAAALLPHAPLLDGDEFRRQAPQVSTLVVHFSGYGYSADGAPAELVEALLAWRQQQPGRRLLVWIHELYARQAPWRRGFWYAPRQKRVVQRLAAGADGLITNLERHARWLRARRLPPLAVLPVPSNVGEPLEPPPLAARAPRLVVFGGVAQRQAAYRALQPLGPWLRQLGLEAIDDIGSPLPAPPRAPLPVQLHGRLSAEAVSARLLAARAAAVAYPLDFAAKSGILAAIAAHGCLPLLLRPGRRRGPCDGLRGGHQLLRPHDRGAAASTPSACEAVASAAWSWYQPHRLAVQRQLTRRWLAHDLPPATASSSAISEVTTPTFTFTATATATATASHSHSVSATASASHSHSVSATTDARPRRLLLYCHAYLPSLGGLERAGQLLAEQLSGPAAVERPGPRWRIDLVTATAAADGAWDRAQPYRLWRRPSLLSRLRLVAAADLVHSNGSSLAVSLLAVLLRKPLVITHQGYQLVSVDGLGWGDSGPTPLAPAASLAWYRRRMPVAAWARQVLLLRLRRWVAARAAANVAISAWVDWRQPLPRRRLIPNPVALEIGAGDRKAPLALEAWRARPWDLLFLGRLVQEKGLDVLLRALPLLEQGWGLRPCLRVIGDGPMAPAWRALSDSLGLSPRVAFAGSLRGEPLAQALQQARIGVVPSVWEEPMGMVAAEFLAAGVLPVVSQRGGLAEVVGAAGLVFANGDPAALAAQLARLLDPGPSRPAGAAADRCGEAPRSGPALVAELLGQAPQQLQRSDPARVAAAYASLYASLLRAAPA